VTLSLPRKFRFILVHFRVFVWEGGSKAEVGGLKWKWGVDQPPPFPSLPTLINDADNNNNNNL